jgi:hypothetical protein
MNLDDFYIDGELASERRTEVSDKEITSTNNEPGDSIRESLRRLKDYEVCVCSIVFMQPFAAGMRRRQTGLHECNFSKE